jgi:hypothetical protein
LLPASALLFVERKKKKKIAKGGGKIAGAKWVDFFSEHKIKGAIALAPSLIPYFYKKRGQGRKASACRLDIGKLNMHSNI